MARISIASWLLINFGVRVLLRKHHDIARFERDLVASQAAGPAQPSCRIRRRLDIEATRVADVAALRVRAKGSSPRRRVLYLHGGAYVREMIRPQWTLIAGMAEHVNAEVIVPTYGLAPRHTVSVILPRMLAFVDALRAESDSQLALAGDSAGGGLALALTHLLRDEGRPLPTSLVLYFPWLDVTLSDPAQDAELDRLDLTLSPTLLRRAGRMWAGDLDADDPRVSPLFGCQNGLPPTLALGGGADLLVSDCRRLADRCPSAVVREYPGMFHGWICVGTPEGRAALHEATEFLLAHFRQAERANDLPPSVVPVIQQGTRVEE